MRKRWGVVVIDREPHGCIRPGCSHETVQFVDGPFRFRWVARTHASSHRAHEAQRARYEHDAMRKVDVEVWEELP